ncbi:MAG: hypothetical protein ACYTAF_08980 [Planctomycetota bacterium]
MVKALVLAMLLSGGAQDPPPSVDDTSRYTGAPLTLSSNLGFSHLFHIPPLESAHAISNGGVQASLGLDVTISDLTVSDGGDIMLNESQVMEEFLELRAGFALMTTTVEVGARLNGTKFEELDGFTFLAEDGSLMFPANESREWDFSSVVLHGKLELPSVTDKLTVGALVQGKLGLGDEDNLVDAGSDEIAIAGLATIESGKFVITANLGAVFPISDTEVFTLSAQDVELAEIIVYGGSVAYRPGRGYSFLLQFQGWTSAYDEVEALDDNINYIAAGMKMMLYEGPPNLYVQIGAGADISDLTDDWFISGSVTLIFR